MDFPLNHNTRGWDSKGYKPTQEDPAIKTEMEGGYMVSRARHTRTPRTTFKLTWKGMTDADMVTLKNFYNTKRGGSSTFTWDDPASAAQAPYTSYTVRFKGPISYQYAGMGAVRLWDVDLELEQV